MRRGKRVRVIINVGGIPHLDWCDFPVTATILLTHDQAKRLLKRLAGYVAKTTAGDHIFQFDLRGYAYATGELPPAATFLKDGSPAPGIVIVNDVDGWEFHDNRTK